MMKQKLLFIVFLLIAVATKGQVFYSQNFDNPATLASIQSATPSVNQMNKLGAAVASDGSPAVTTSISVANNKLRIDRKNHVNPAERVFFVRTTPMAPATQFIKVQFKLSLSDHSAGNGNTQATFSFGNSYIADHNNEDANSWERIGINLNTPPNGTFALRDGTGSTNITPTPTAGLSTTNGTGYAINGIEQTITFYLNATNEPQAYTGPDAVARVLPGQRWNAFVGNDIQFTTIDRVPANCANIINNFKFFASGGNVIYDLDDLIMESLPTVLPVSLTSFTGKWNGRGTELNWQTASEQNNSHFEILRSTDGKAFIQIDIKAGKSNSQEISNYTYTDNSASPGLNYYKLRQVDFDGKTKEYEAISIKNPLATAGKLTAYLTKEGQLAVNVNAATSGNASVEVRNIAGDFVCGNKTMLIEGANQLLLPVANVAKGVYIVVVRRGSVAQSSKFIK